MRKDGRKLLGTVSVFFLILFLAGSVPGASAQDFSADLVNTFGKETTQSKLYVSGEKIRMEMKEGIMIVRTDKRVSWMLMPSEKMYMENPIDMTRVPKTGKNFDGEIERISLGSDSVDGQPTEKFKVTYTENGKSMAAYQWIKDGQIPVKVEAVDGSYSMEYKNISTGAQPAELFEVPADYEKMSMPSLGDMMPAIR